MLTMVASASIGMVVALLAHEVAPALEGLLDHHAHADDARLRAFDDPRQRPQRLARRQKVVDDQHVLVAAA